MRPTPLAFANILQKKHGVILQAIKQHFGDKAKVIGQGAGLHIFLELANSISNEVKLINKAKRHDVHLFLFSTLLGGKKPIDFYLVSGADLMTKSPKE